MNPKLFEEIESPRFSAVVNVVSGYKQFLKTLDSFEIPGFGRLRDQIKSFADAKTLVVRIIKLAESHAGSEYENPCDAALAAYLWMLSKNRPAAARTAAEYVRNSKNCWWAWKLADGLFEETQQRSAETGSYTKVMIWPPQAKAERITSEGTGIHYFTPSQGWQFIADEPTPKQVWQPRPNQGTVDDIIWEDRRLSRNPDGTYRTVFRSQPGVPHLDEVLA